MNQFDTLLQNAKRQDNLDIIGFAEVVFPYIDILSCAKLLAAAYVITVKQGAQEHIVVVCTMERETGDFTNPYEQVFKVWCGDKFLQGALSRTEAHFRSQLAIDNLRGRGAMTLEQTQVLNTMMASYGYFEKSPQDSCDFWTQWRRSQTLCAHTEHALASLRELCPNFKEYLSKKLYETLAKFPDYLASRAYNLSFSEEKKPTVNPSEKALLGMASAFVTLNLSMENLTVFPDESDARTILNVFTSDCPAPNDPGVEIVVEMARNRETAKETIKAYGNSGDLVLITPEAEVVTNAALAARLAHASSLIQMRVFSD